MLRGNALCGASAHRGKGVVDRLEESTCIVALDSNRVILLPQRQGYDLTKDAEKMLDNSTEPHLDTRSEIEYGC